MTKIGRKYFTCIFCAKKIARRLSVRCFVFFPQRYNTELAECNNNKMMVMKIFDHHPSPTVNKLHYVQISVVQALYRISVLFQWLLLISSTFFIPAKCYELFQFGAERQDEAGLGLAVHPFTPLHSCNCSYYFTNVPITVTNFTRFRVERQSLLC